jgi:hypothetical protein
MVALLFGSAVAKADVVLDWNAIAVNKAVANGQNPVAQARFAAIPQLAVFEAVNAITGDYWTIILRLVEVEPCWLSIHLTVKE